jgi:nitrogen fixation NifU-like protein
MLTLPTGQDVDISEVGKLAVLSGVREFPVRVKCASLAWHTMKTALARPGATAKTE